MPRLLICDSLYCDTKDNKRRTETLCDKIKIKRATAFLKNLRSLITDESYKGAGIKEKTSEGFDPLCFVLCVITGLIAFSSLYSFLSEQRQCGAIGGEFILGIVIAYVTYIFIKKRKNEN